MGVQLAEKQWEKKQEKYRLQEHYPWCNTTVFAQKKKALWVDHKVWKLCILSPRVKDVNKQGGGNDAGVSLPADSQEHKKS